MEERKKAMLESISYCFVSKLKQDCYTISFKTGPYNTTHAHCKTINSLIEKFETLIRQYEFENMETFITNFSETHAGMPDKDMVLEFIKLKYC
jgi:hypothetical protein